MSVLKPLSLQEIASLCERMDNYPTDEQLAAVINAERERVRRATAEELAQEFEAHAVEMEANPAKEALAKIARATAAYVRTWAREAET